MQEVISALLSDRNTAALVVCALGSGAMSLVLFVKSVRERNAPAPSDPGFWRVFALVFLLVAVGLIVLAALSLR